MHRFLVPLRAARGQLRVASNSLARMHRPHAAMTRLTLTRQLSSVRQLRFYQILALIITVWGLLILYSSLLVDTTAVQHSVVIGIPTVARKDNPDYLHKTLTSIKRHGFPIDAVYVMHANTDVPHPVLEACRSEFEFHSVQPTTLPILVEYTPTHLKDGQVHEAYLDSPHQKQWRLREARDWMHLMGTLLHDTNAEFIGINQDDGEWFGPYPSPTDPITSLWSTRDQPECHGVGGHCGMVSFVFERATLRKFLDWMAVDGRWMEKPIDWTLNDFVKAFGYKMPVRMIVRHIGKIRSIIQ